jgi:hypothetical protein
VPVYFLTVFKTLMRSEMKNRICKQLKKEIMDAKFEIKSSDGRVLKVFEDYVVLTQKGVRGFIARGLAGEKVIFYKDISSVQFKNCGWMAGYMEFVFAGSGDKTGGIMDGVTNENRFSFGRPTIGAAKKLAQEMAIVNDFILNKIRDYKSTHATNSQNTISQPDIINQIKQLSDLKDQGILSEEEFDTKKQELLSRI